MINAQVLSPHKQQTPQLSQFAFYLKSAIAYLPVASRRRVCSRSKLLQTPCNTEDAVKEAIPKGTNFKNFFYSNTQQYDVLQNTRFIC